MAELTKKKFLDITGLGAFWTKAKKYVDDKSSDLTGTINGLTFNYVSEDKTIVLKNGDTNIGTVNCADFIKDSFVKSGAVVTGDDGKQYLELTLITVERPGETGTTQIVKIDVDKLFSQNASDIKMEGGKSVQVALTNVIAESAKNKTDITTLNGKVTSIEESQITFGSRLGNIDAAYKAADKALEGKLTKLDTDYKAADTTINGRIDGVEAAYQAADTAVYNSIEAIAVEDINALFTGAQA